MAQTAEGAIKIAAKKRDLTVEEYLEKVKTHKWCRIGKHWAKRCFFTIDNTRHDNLSYKCTECTKSKAPYSSLKGRESTFKGKKHSEEAKLKNSIAQKELIQKGIRKPPMEGKTHSLETRKKISQILRDRGVKGEKCHSYKDGKTAERKGERFSAEYKRWRFDVFARDKFTCQECKDDKGGNLNAHHIKPFSDFPELRFDIFNGITLCKTCHDKIHHKADSIRNKRKNR